MKIAIDGPAGAGKSTVAKEIAHQLGILYIDTGAMYRALAWKGLQQGIDFANSPELEELARCTAVHLENEDEKLRVYCDGQDVTSDIRTPEVSKWVSVVAANPVVREEMVEQQQAIARHADVVMDGRDITHCVLPDAEFKFFLTASIEERAQRRKLELDEKGYEVNLEELTNEIEERDRRDRERKVGPLKITEDALVIDTSHMQSNEVIERVLKIVRGG
ncbi:MAG: (d)CMP kinase [Candidatus Saccharibacteria bacterium]